MKRHENIIIHEKFVTVGSDGSRSRAAAGSVSEGARGVVKVCHKAGVNRVIPAIHHGCLHFLLSEGPENIGGIVFRDDTYDYDALKELADEVNEMLQQNSKVSHE